MLVPIILAACVLWLFIPWLLLAVGILHEEAK